MDHPYGHHNHHHERRDDDERPPPSQHRYHSGENEYDPPPPRVTSHVSHDHGFRPHETDDHASSGGVVFDLSDKPTYRVFSKAAPDFHLTVRDSEVVLAPSDPSDEFQNWFKDEKYSIRVKDEERSPSFSLVNKATGQALKHSIGASHPVQLIPYNSDVLDESVLWTMSKDFGDGYRTIRMVNDIHLNVDAFHGDKKSGGVHDGTAIVLWKWNKGDNQLWKIVPHTICKREIFYIRCLDNFMVICCNS
ncbi:hypothetical protein ACFE04_021885 [Oxalis oulophora]